MRRRIFALVTVLLIPIIASAVYFWFFYSQNQQIWYQGTLRSYRIHRPLENTSPSPVPLLIMLHGYGDNPRLSEFYSGFSSLADRQKFLVVYPYGTNGKEDANLSWNAGFCCALAMRDKVDDVGFINFLVDELSGKYAIDQTRVYVAGYSNGAMMAYRLVAENPRKYAAVAAVAGTVAGESFPDKIYSHVINPTSPVSAITFHGDRDLVVPFLGGENYFQNQQGLAKFSSFGESIEFWSKVDQCPVPSAGQPYTGITLRTYSECSKGSEVRAYSLSGRGHIWPGGFFETSIYGRILGISASETIWNFFLQHPLLPD